MKRPRAAAAAGSLLIMLLCPPRSLAAATQPDQFGAARILAARMIQTVTPGMLDVSWLESPDFGRDVQAWYTQYRVQLRADIQASKHIWVDANPNGACGQTEHSAAAEVHLSYGQCRGPGYVTITEQAKFLIGESAHHLPRTVQGRQTVVGDEFSDWVKQSVLKAWEKLPPATVAQQSQSSDVVGPVLPGAYQSASYSGGMMLVNAALRPIITADTRAYPGVEVGYQFEGAFAWDGNLKAWITATTMGFTGQVNYAISGVSFLGPKYCEVNVWFIVRPNYDGKALNVTIRRPARIEPQGCRAWEFGYVDENLAFVYAGNYSGAW